MNAPANDDRLRREALLGRLYRAWQEEGLYRGVVGRKDLAAELNLDGPVMERNLEYLLERGFIRMHKIEDLISITPDGIDRVEAGDSGTQAGRVEALLGRIEELLRLIAGRLGS